MEGHFGLLLVCSAVLFWCAACVHVMPVEYLCYGVMDILFLGAGASLVLTQVEVSLFMGSTPLCIPFCQI